MHRGDLNEEHHPTVLLCVWQRTKSQLLCHLVCHLIWQLKHRKEDIVPVLVRKAERIYGDFVGTDTGIYLNVYFFIPLISLTTKSLLISSTLQSQPGYSKQSLAGAYLTVIVLGLSRMESASHSSPCRAVLCTGS